MPITAPVHRLAFSALGLHGADQIAMAALPLTAVLTLGAGPGMVGVLLAAQATAWLVFSLPAGLLVDHWPRARLLMVAAALSAAGAALALPAAGIARPGLLGIAIFLASCGTVLFVLSAGALVPGFVPREGLAKANASLEFARAAASLAAPPLAGLLANWGMPAAAYGIAALTAAMAFAAARGLPAGPKPHTARRLPVREQLMAGARFVLDHPVLRNIGLCALCWNFGFFALMAALVPYALTVLDLGPARLGLAQAGYGAGLVAGAWLAAETQRRLGPNVILIAGPALSMTAPLLMLMAPGQGVALPFLAMFLIGFGPMMWLICQTGVRQMVTPAAMLGRVGASLQIANYGVRPIGALTAGTLAASMGPEAGLWVAAAGFAASLTVALVSDLARLRDLPSAVAG